MLLQLVWSTSVSWNKSCPCWKCSQSVCLALLAADPVLGTIEKVFCYREPVNFWAQTIVPICHTLQHKWIKALLEEQELPMRRLAIFGNDRACVLWAWMDLPEHVCVTERLLVAISFLPFLWEEVLCVCVSYLNLPFPYLIYVYFSMSCKHDNLFWAHVQHLLAGGRQASS